MRHAARRVAYPCGASLSMYATLKLLTTRCASAPARSGLTDTLNADISMPDRPSARTAAAADGTERQRTRSGAAVTPHSSARARVGRTCRHENQHGTRARAMRRDTQALQEDTEKEQRVCTPPGHPAGRML
jgi:hypothetical protein